MTNLRSIHPFPARMAPEIALAGLTDLEPGSRLLDPMCGSGTVLRAGVENGLRVLGRDIDPFAVLIAKVWTSPPARSRFLNEVSGVVTHAMREIRRFPSGLTLDDESREFIEYWFAEPQLTDLARLAVAIRDGNWMTRDALWLVFGSLIIAKDRGASLARDVSHSRPHRVAEQVAFSVLTEFERSADRMASRFRNESVGGVADVRQGDSRSLSDVPSSSIDRIITSPPYLNALDYLRGHRLALVWMGHSTTSLRHLRSSAIGAERILTSSPFDPMPFIDPSSDSDVPRRVAGWARRYLEDAHEAVVEAQRVLRPGGEVTFVVGNSNLQGCRVDNAEMFRDRLLSVGIEITSLETREIPLASRYLPTPKEGSGLARRMRTEVVLTGRKPA